MRQGDGPRIDKEAMSQSIQKPGSPSVGEGRSPVNALLRSLPRFGYDFS